MTHIDLPATSSHRGGSRAPFQGSKVSSMADQGPGINRRTYRTFEPVSLGTAAPGWRAIYIHEPSEGEPGWSANPLIAWAIYQVTTRPVKGSAARERSEGRQI